MLTERWLIADYLVPEYYEGVSRPPVAWAVVLGLVGAAIIAATFYASMRMVDVLLDRGAIVPWWIAAALLLTGCASLVVGASVDPQSGRAAAARNLPGTSHASGLERHGGAVSLRADFLCEPLCTNSPGPRAARAGRLRWARDILEGRRWAHATFPLATVGMLALVASIALMGLGLLEWQTLVDTSARALGRTMVRGARFTSSAALSSTWFRASPPSGGCALGQPHSCRDRPIGRGDSGGRCGVIVSAPRGTATVSQAFSLP